MSIHADDILMCADPSVADDMKALLSRCFKVKWGEAFGPAWVKYLGREWRCVNGCFEVRIPPKYWEEVFEQFQMTQCKTASSPMAPESVVDDDSAHLGPEMHAVFRSALGKIAWTVGERPDCAFAVKELSRKAAAPTENDLSRLKRLVRYLKGTQDLVLRLGDGPGSMDEVTVVCDASWGNATDRKSTTGFLVYFNGTLLVSVSRTQSTVAMSSCESELTALQSAASEAAHCLHVLEELQWRPKIAARTDSASAISFAHRKGVGRIKHLDLRRFFLQEWVRADKLSLTHVPTGENAADLLTKAFAKVDPTRLGLYPS
jgi:hypothetical protein